jgi:glyoxylase-like metal-dependent hydrolase (beta-lactamase superfamily II)
LKKVLAIVLGLLVVLVVPIVAIGAVTFGGLVPLEDESLGELGEVVTDGYVSMGLIDVGEGKIALIDAGADEDGKALLAALTRRGRNPEDVVAVFLTHGHRDHVAGVHLLPNATAHLIASELPYLSGKTEYRGPLPGLMGVEDPGFRPVALADRDRIQVGTRAIEVFAVPGHTVGSAAYLVDDVLFLGDAASLEADGGLRSGPWLFSDDVDRQSASVRSLARALKGRRIEKMVFAHTGSASSAAPLESFGR